MDIDHAMKLAVLESKVLEMECLPDRVLLLENDVKYIRNDLADIKGMQVQSSSDRHTQYNQLSAQIQTHHQLALQEITKTTAEVAALFTSINTIKWMIGSIFSFLTLIAVIYGAWPK